MFPDRDFTVIYRPNGGDLFYLRTGRPLGDGLWAWTFERDIRLAGVWDYTDCITLLAKVWEEIPEALMAEIGQASGGARATLRG